MVLEIAELTAAEGKADALAAGLRQALPVILSAQGCLSAEARRCLEDSDRFVLVIHWATVEDHVVTFRQGPLFKEYRSHINGLFVEPIVARHYELVAD